LDGLGSFGVFGRDFVGAGNGAGVVAVPTAGMPRVLSGVPYLDDSGGGPTAEVPPGSPDPDDPDPDRGGR
jgi:hypothetical protein